MAKTNPNCTPYNRPKEKINMRDLKPKTDEDLVKSYNKKFNQKLELNQLTDPMRNIIKKKLLLLILVLFSFSCTPDEVAKDNQDCNCGEIIEASYFQNSFSVFKVKNYCTGEIKQITKDGQYKKGDEYCGR